MAFQENLSEEQQELNFEADYPYGGVIEDYDVERENEELEENN